MLRLDHITYSVGDFRLSPVSLSIENGEYFTLLGPSGSGKSILIEIIAGLRKIDSGEIACNGIGHDCASIANISSLPPQKRPVGLLFQDYALFPHLSVYDNIAYPLTVSKVSKEIIHREIERLAASLDILPLLKRWPETLSGGEKQRVALARTLAKNPAVLLLDEPLSALDASLRNSSLKMLKGLTADGRLSVIHVTHDEQEARSVADKIGYMEKGCLIKTI